MWLLSIDHQGITSLADYFQQHYIGSQAEIEILDCSFNELETLEGCPTNVKRLFCTNNKLTSLRGCPEGVEQLYCGHNQLKTLSDCPPGIKIIDCPQNQLRNLIGCPPQTRVIAAWDNPLDPEWKNLKNDELVQKAQIARIQRGVEIVNRVTGWKWRLVRRFCNNLLDKWYAPDVNGIAPYAMWTWRKFQEECGQN